MAGGKSVLLGLVLLASVSFGSCTQVRVFHAAVNFPSAYLNCTGASPFFVLYGTASGYKDVSATSIDCTVTPTTGAPTTVSLPLTANASTLVLYEGAPFEFQVYGDDLSPVATGTNRVRFLDASTCTFPVEIGYANNELNILAGDLVGKQMSEFVDLVGTVALEARSAKGPEEEEQIEVQVWDISLPQLCVITVVLVGECKLETTSPMSFVSVIDAQFGSAVRFFNALTDSAATLAIAGTALSAGYAGVSNSSMILPGVYNATSSDLSLEIDLVAGSDHTVVQCDAGLFVLDNTHAVPTEFHQLFVRFVNVVSGSSGTLSVTVNGDTLPPLPLASTTAPKTLTLLGGTTSVVVSDAATPELTLANMTVDLKERTDVSLFLVRDFGGTDVTITVVTNKDYNVPPSILFPDPKPEITEAGDPGAILGGIVGAIAGICLIYFVVQHIRSKRKQASSDVEYSPAPTL